MEEILTTQGEIINKKNAKALYDIAKHLDTLLTHNGANWNERLCFAKAFFTGNGLYVPDYEIKMVDSRKVVEKFVDEQIKEAIPAKEAYIEYREWCKDNGIEPLLKQRFIATVRDIAIVKANYQGARNVIFPVFDDYYMDSTVENTKNFIIGALRGGRMKIKTLNDMAYKKGISPDTLKRAKTELYNNEIIKSVKISRGKGNGIDWYLDLIGEEEV